MGPRGPGEGPKGMGPGRFWPEGLKELPTGRVSTVLECTRVVQIPPPQQEDKVPSPLNPFHQPQNCLGTLPYLTACMADYHV